MFTKYPQKKFKKFRTVQINLNSLKSIISILKKYKINKIVMLGNVNRPSLMDIKFDIDTLQKISNDRYESGNAFFIVFLSLFSLYFPVILSVRMNNLSDIVFFGILDGAFAWVFASLGMWFMISKVFNETLDISQYFFNKMFILKRLLVF